jgi:hypothetical protein
LVARIIKSPKKVSSSPATILREFGLKSGVGADTLSHFFKMVRVDTHVGVSPSVLRTQLNNMERLLPRFQNECEQRIKKEPRKIVAPEPF